MMDDLVPQSFDRLLVPLDGSRLAEAALPPTLAVASRFGSSVTLLHVLESRPPATIHGEPHLDDKAEARRYLEGVAVRIAAEGIPVSFHVHEPREGHLASSLVAHADEIEPDLVIMCSHGQGGLKGLLFGRIAQQVLQRGTRPLLVLHPTEDGEAPAFDPKRVFVPLDGIPSHEVALPAALAFARAFAAELHLAMVVPTVSTLARDRAATGVLLPMTTKALLDLSEENAGAYLGGIAGRCRASGVPVTTEVLRGDTVEKVIEGAERLGADLLAMASHGRIGLDAYFAGSVAHGVTTRVRKPLLLIRAIE